jgi:hypothetical protein
VSVSRKKFLDYLETVDYVKVGKVKLDSALVIAECEETAKNNPGYWWSLVVDENNFEEWNGLGKDLRKTLQTNKDYGYTSDNTRSWKTTCNKPQIHMSWEKGLIAQIPLLDKINTPTLQKPGNVMPWHQDRFYYFKQTHADSEFVARFLVFLKDWELGHVLQAGNSIISHWSAGDIITWHPTRMHLSANIGITNKWTNNLTGILPQQIDFVIPGNKGCV